MSKRRSGDQNNDDHKKKRPKITLEDCPAINNLTDLIAIGKTNKFYKNINMIMLWNIVEHLEDLQNMIGMRSLKESIFFQVIYYLQNMHKRNRNEEYLHTILMGSPGTGKTTVAKILGQIYQDIGILSKNGDFRIAYRDDLIGEYLGSTALKTRRVLDSCIGGVLFIDEVYALGPGKKDSDSYSKECIDTLCSFLSEHKNDFCCIVAGYEDDIKKCFLSVNQGLERRFPWVHKIDKYSTQDLSDIFKKMVNEMKWSLDEEVSNVYLNTFFKENEDLFKHSGGSLETFLSKCKMMHAKRVFNLDKETKFIITQKDINNTVEYINKNKTQEDKKFLSYYT